MKLIIFAGGIGTRLWPLSRENSPKQFDRIFNGKSTIQLAVDRVGPAFGIDNIYIQTVEKYKNIIKEQIPEISDDNILIEPARRDLGPAVCFSAIEMEKRGHKGAMSLLWADHLMDRLDEFIEALKVGKKLINQDSNRFVFMAERPRFANNNLGWICVNSQKGEIDGRDYFGFAGWKYRPETSECDKMFKSGNYFWNPGYFITSVEFLSNQYQNLAPEIYHNVFNDNYEKAEIINFDKAIIEKVDLSSAVVIKTNMGWSDPGTLYAMKEALEESSRSNVVSGKVSHLNSTDCLLYNLEPDKLLTAVGLSGMVVVNTPDAILVVPKDEVVNISNLVKKLKLEDYNDYL